MKKLDFYKNKISDTTKQVKTLAMNKKGDLKNKTIEYKGKGISLIRSKKELVSTFVSTKVEVVKAVVIEKYKVVDTKVLQKINFNFHHFTSVVVIALVAFFVTFYTTGYNTSSVDAAVNLDEMSIEVGVFNNEAIVVEYGDSAAIAEVAKTMLADVIPSSSELVEIKSTGMTSVYALNDYIVSVELLGSSVLGSMPAELTIQTATTYAMKNATTFEFALDEATTEILDGSVYTYQLDVTISDTTAPVIELSTNDMTISDTDDWNLESYARAIDNVDGSVTVTLEEEMDTESNGKYTAGNHYLTVIATDSAGNTSTASLIVRVKETYEYSSSSSSSSSSYSFSSAASYSGGSTIAASALSQVGWNQDCTMLVTNALKSVGIYFHGWPSEYYSLGTIVSASEAEPGDICIYSGHVAIYIGNGLAVHGGWNSYTTVVYSVYCNSGSPTYVRVTG